MSFSHIYELHYQLQTYQSLSPMTRFAGNTEEQFLGFCKKKNPNSPFMLLTTRNRYVFKTLTLLLLLLHMGKRCLLLYFVFRCCQVHDECYSKLQKSKLCPFKYAVYTLPYSLIKKVKCSELKIRQSR